MTSRLERITEQRLDSLSRIRARGIDPYPHGYHPSHNIRETRVLFKRQGENAQNISLAGRIMSKRSMGKMSFLDIRDSSGKIQLSFRYNLLGRERYEFLQETDIGDIIGVEGRLFRTKTGELTLEVSDFAMLCKSLRPLPEKWHGLADVEKRYRQRYLDLISNEGTKNIFILRSKIIAAMRDFLDKQGFMEVETSVLQPHAGGAVARPFITHHHALDEDLYLRIALELPLKKLIVGGFDKVYEIGRVFRNEGISVQHNPEFTMLECYQAYADYNDIMNLVEEMVSYIAGEVLGDTKIPWCGKTIDLAPPWQRRYLREAIKEYCGVDFEDYADAASLRSRMIEMGIEVDPDKGRGKLINELVSIFVEPKLIRPTFLLDYPVEVCSLAKRKRDNVRLVEKFEAYINGIEIANAYTELNDPMDQRERFQQGAMGEEIESGDEDFIQALEYGMPPTGGLGIGIDRLVMMFTGQQSVREVILFPQLKTKE